MYEPVCIKKFVGVYFKGDVPSASEHRTLSKQLAKLSPIVQLTNIVQTKKKVTTFTVVSDKARVD